MDAFKMAELGPWASEWTIIIVPNTLQFAETPERGRVVSGGESSQEENDEETLINECTIVL